MIYAVLSIGCLVLCSVHFTLTYKPHPIASLGSSIVEVSQHSHGVLEACSFLANWPVILTEREDRLYCQANMNSAQIFLDLCEFELPVIFLPLELHILDNALYLQT